VIRRMWRAKATLAGLLLAGGDARGLLLGGGAATGLARMALARRAHANADKLRYAQASKQ
jgi:hypothetical protein